MHECCSTAMGLCTLTAHMCRYVCYTALCMISHTALCGTGPHLNVKSTAPIIIQKFVKATILEQSRRRLFQNGGYFGTTSGEVVPQWPPFWNNFAGKLFQNGGHFGTTPAKLFHNGRNYGTTSSKVVPKWRPLWNNFAGVVP